MTDDRLHGSHGGMSDEDQPLIPLNRLTIVVETSAHVELTPELSEELADAIWKFFPPLADDGDVFVKLETGL